ncbi:uncharacterized protein B0T15DRAFT_182402 [Chaetomium strumarium]|uniref:Uncharacterized protein n=1 Tax=Chaetomium strumarium TaxID=1170767 RepID=A0AAJ0M3F3_9PEZI|nr:hypothetical protein B0T15DRAFT_182402 [Chaetomium strumarium]
MEVGLAGAKGRGDLGGIPWATSCPIHCPLCGIPRQTQGHSPAICDERVVCQDCKYDTGDFRAAFHFTQDCPKHLCAAETCSTVPAEPCTRHCRDCGSPVVDIEELDEPHQCQWTKLEKCQAGIKDGRPAFVYRFTITCKRNPAHEKRIVRSLAKVREKGWLRLLDDMVSCWPDPDEDRDPRKKRPIVECAECCAEMYERGDYKEQNSGRSRFGRPSEYVKGTTV